MIRKNIAIYQDQRIAEEFCNFCCEYCGGLCPIEYMIKKDKNGNLTVPQEWYKMIEAMPHNIKKHFKSPITLINHYNLSKDIMSETKKVISSDILKISGGELTLYDDLCDFVYSIHKDYLSIQILSNGFKIKKEDIPRYKEMGNISFQISLDGVTAELNYSKSHSEFITKRVLENIKLLLDNEIGVEINCVLTKYNTDKFLEFLKYFKDAKNFIVVPRPVRGEARNNIDFSKKQVTVFAEQIEKNYDIYSNILPPKKYFERVINMMITGKRNYKCYIPYFVQSIDGYGNLELCPLGLEYKNKINIMENSSSNVEVLLDSEYNISNIYDRCKYCMVQYEMFNLYVDNEILEGELRKMPSLNNDTIISHVDDIKKEIESKYIENEIRKNYDIDIVNLEKNDESTDGNVYIIETKNEKYVGKIYKDLKHVDSIIKLHETLFDKLHISKIIYTKGNEKYIGIDGEQYIVLFSFLDGVQICEQYKNIPVNVASEIGKQLKYFHDLTQNCEYGFKELPFSTNDDLNRNSLLHFDLTRSNIFCYGENNSKIGFIDFDDAKYGKSICDVAITASNLFFSKTRGADMEGLKAFIDSYYGENLELKKQELCYIKDYAINWIDYIMDGNEFDTSTVESFEVRKELLEKYMICEDFFD